MLGGPRRNNQGATITIQLRTTQRLAGRVRNRSGRPVAGQEVEVWSRGDSLRRMNPVVFQDGPVRTKADGSFRTPANLLVGSTYMVAVRTPGFEPVFSRWITIGEQPPPLLPLLQRPLRTIRGRVVDRQAKALADVEVFQSGDGPERTATKTQADGQFVLGGFREGPVFLFARREGFRFFGKLIKPGEEEVAVRMIRIGEHPAPKLHMLPAPVPRQESQELTRRLIEPCWEAAVARKDQAEAFQLLIDLAYIDPIDALRKLETEDAVSPARAPTVKEYVVRALARSDPDRAEKLAESIDSPSTRSSALWYVAAALPKEARARKIALFERVAVQAKADNRPGSVASAAGKLYDLGEKAKARALVAEYHGAGKVAPGQRVLFALEMARLDPVTSLGIARELAASDRQDANQILWNVAIADAADNPAEAERVLRLVPEEEGQTWMYPPLAWKLAQSDPARAQRLVDESQRHDDSPQTYLYLACGLKERDPAAADAAFWKGIKGIDRLTNEGAPYLARKIRGGLATLLPLVEQIDPSIVPEVFWRALAARPPLDSPRSIGDDSLSYLTRLLCWYDREAVAAVFETERAVREQAGESVLAISGTRFQSWVLWDPRAAVAEIERLKGANDQENRYLLRLKGSLATILCRPYEDRWHLNWQTYGYGHMKNPLDNDVWLR